MVCQEPRIVSEIRAYGVLVSPCGNDFPISGAALSAHIAGRTERPIRDHDRLIAGKAWTALASKIENKASNRLPQTTTLFSPMPIIRIALLSLRFSALILADATGEYKIKTKNIFLVHGSFLRSIARNCNHGMPDVEQIFPYRRGGRPDEPGPSLAL